MLPGKCATAMIKGSEARKADHAIEPLLLDRWSPRAMSGEEISQDELMRLFEAARWAPSSFNTQQWRALYARRGTEHWQTFFDLLVDANKMWAKNAAVLVVFISRKLFDHDNEPSVTHSYDCGAAWENFALQGFHQGLVVHGMEGFDQERARKELQIPDEFQVEAMAAVGRPGPKELLPERLQARESPNDRRKVSESQIEFRLTTDRFDRQIDGRRSSDPKQRGDCARRGECGADHHYPAKAGHERFIDCVTD